MTQQSITNQISAPIWFDLHGIIESLCVSVGVPFLILSETGFIFKRVTFGVFGTAHQLGEFQKVFKQVTKAV